MFSTCHNLNLICDLVLQSGCLFLFLNTLRLFFKALIRTYRRYYVESSKKAQGRESVSLWSTKGFGGQVRKG